MRVLAEMNWEAAAVIVGIISLLIDLALGVGLYYIGSKASKIDQLEERLHKKADELIAAKFELLSAKMEVPLERLSVILENVLERLGKGDESFTSQEERTQRIELRNTAVLGELRTWVMGEFATKEEVNALAANLQALQNAVTGLRVVIQAKGGNRSE